MPTPSRSIVVFDLGGVLIDWNPRHLYRKLIADEAAMEHFLANVCTQDWNERQDAGRSFAEAAALLKLEHADKADLIDAFGERFDEMMAGPIAGTVDILGELLSAGAAPLRFPRLVPRRPRLRRGRPHQARSAHLPPALRAFRHPAARCRLH